MDAVRVAKVKEKAKKINDISERYQLLHATYATEQMIRDIIQECNKEKLLKLSEKIKKCSDNKIGELMEEKTQLEDTIKNKRVSIGVDYIKITTGRARVVRTSNTFTIYLPEELRSKIKEDGHRNYDIIKEIRLMMAHELGHLILHTNVLAEDKTLSGSLNINDDDRESEANIFAQELIELRRQRNHEISKDGGAHNLM